MTLSLPTAALLAGVVLFLGVFLYRAAMPKPIPGIPYSKEAAKSLFGDVPEALKYHAETSEMMSFLTKKHLELNSPVFQAFMRPFGRPWVVVCDGREAQDVMTRRGKEFDRSTFFGDLFATILPNMQAVLPTDDHWRNNRRLMGDTMSPSFLNTVGAPAVHRNALDLVDLWTEKTRLAKGRTIDVTNDVKMCTVDTIWAAAFGDGLDVCRSQVDFLRKVDSCPLPQAREAIAELPVGPKSESYECLKLMAASSEIPMNHPLGRTAHWFAVRFIPKYRQALATRDRLVSEKVEASSKVFGQGGTGSRAVKSGIDLVIERETAAAKKEGRAPQYDSPSVHDELAGFLQAGFETTASTTAWGTKYLGKYQDVQKKLRAALRETHKTAFDSGEQPSHEAIAKTSVPYLDAFIEEVLRHSCIVTSNIRYATQDTKVLGFFIPKGTDVFFLTNGPGFKSTALPIDEKKRSRTSQESKDQATRYKASDLADFRPERWLAKNEKGEVYFDGNAAAMQSFGAGLRGCFGKRLAYLEMRVIYTLMVWNFNFQPIPAVLDDFKARDVLTHQAQNVRVSLGPAP